mgnify:FL=1
MNSDNKQNYSLWKRYYYNYLESFTGFIVHSTAKSFHIDVSTAIKSLESGDQKFFKENKSEAYDYIVANDVLGYVHNIEDFFRDAKANLTNDGRIFITQYSALWEPIMRLASNLGLRRGLIEQNWLSRSDLKNFSYLAGLDVVKSGTKMLMPIYIPFISYFLNNIIANIWPFTHLGLFHYIVVRKAGVSIFENKPSISIVVPARNEAGTIEKIVKELPSLGSFTEIILIEGNSTDNTWDEIQRVAKMMEKDNGTVGLSGMAGKRIKIVRQAGKGKGDAVRRGFDMAEGDILAIYDADMTVPAESISRFYDVMVENKADFVNGSRLVYPLQKESMRILNYFGNKFFSLAFSWILSQQLKDTLCGTKVLRKKDYEKIKRNRAFFGDFDPFGDFDLLFGAAKLNLKIVDLPIHYQERIYGSTNISRWKHGWLLLRMTTFAARKIRFI